MSVDLKEIENSVIMELSGKIRSRVKGDKIASDLTISIVEIAAEVVTLYLQEYIKAAGKSNFTD